MHCVLLNLTETLFKLWIREKLSFEKDAPPSEDDHHLSLASLKAISKFLATARRLTLVTLLAQLTGTITAIKQQSGKLG
jgi:hypothetical protein